MFFFNQVVDFHWNSSNLIYLNEYDKDALNQKWLMIGNEIVSFGVQDQADQSRCLDLFYGSVGYGIVVGVYWRHGGLNQLWDTIPIENCKFNVKGTILSFNKFENLKSVYIYYKLQK